MWTDARTDGYTDGRTKRRLYAFPSKSKKMKVKMIWENGKTPGSIACIGKIAVSVLWKLFYGMEMNGATPSTPPAWRISGILFWTRNNIQFIIPQDNIYTSISIASISFTGRMKFIPRWTPLALSPRKGTENTNDVRNSPLFFRMLLF